MYWVSYLHINSYHYTHICRCVYICGSIYTWVYIHMDIYGNNKNKVDIFSFLFFMGAEVMGGRVGVLSNCDYFVANFSLTCEQTDILPQS